MEAPTLATRGIRIIRSSGWRSRAAAAVLIAGIVGGGTLTSPASAHGTTEHVVTMSGTAHLVDYDPDSANEVCDRDFNTSDRAQLSADPNAVLRGSMSCDEVRLEYTFTGVLQTNGNVVLSGNVKLRERDCFFSCSWSTLGTRNFSGTIGPSGVGTASGSISSSGNGNASFTVTFANSF